MHRLHRRCWRGYASAHRLTDVPPSARSADGFRHIAGALSLVRTHKPPQKTAKSPLFGGVFGADNVIQSRQNAEMSPLCRPYVVPLSSLCRTSFRRFRELTGSGVSCYSISSTGNDRRRGAEQDVNVSPQACNLCGIRESRIQLFQLEVEDDCVDQSRLAYS